MKRLLKGLVKAKFSLQGVSNDFRKEGIIVMGYKGVIFDLDGTLVNSLEDIADSMNIVLQRYGFPPHDLPAYRYFIGNGMKNLMHEALPESSRREELIIKYYSEMIVEYHKNCLNKTRPYNGIAELLNKLTSYNLKLAVFSNKIDELTRKIVTALLSDWNFEAVLGFSSKVPRKPNPYGALLIGQKAGISPDELIYVGDTDVDMQTANSAGMYAVGASWGFRTKEELIASGAKYMLDHPLDLINILR
ncbi:MAG: HAD family hydrolase [Desulfitobacteriaceae bacterium]|nr:HAD family hydrolase [Desulfitobacteriaceae bacterium]MDD4346876.1 HAD family hydrolase [Desulfitobacteriaceae bacterium]MDD4402123.1 HAD family hydrolase [Desulfitobacteriaceae bacterium]